MKKWIGWGEIRKVSRKELQCYKEHGIYTRILEIPTTLVDISQEK